MKGMGVFYDAELTSAFLPATLLNVYQKAYDIVPKAKPDVIKSVERIEEDGKPTIWLVNYAEGRPFEYSKHTIDEIGKDNFKYSVIEGGPLGEKFEKISTEFKIKAADHGKSTLKFTCKFYTKANYLYSEEELETARDQAMRLFTDVEKYIGDHP